MQGGRRGVGRRQARGLTAGEQGKEYSAESECAGESELRNGFHSTASVQFICPFIPFLRRSPEKVTGKIARSVPSRNSERLERPSPSKFLVHRVRLPRRRGNAIKVSSARRVGVRQRHDKIVGLGKRGDVRPRTDAEQRGTAEGELHALNPADRNSKAIGWVRKAGDLRDIL